MLFFGGAHDLLLLKDRFCERLAVLLLHGFVKRLSVPGYLIGVHARKPY